MCVLNNETDFQISRNILVLLCRVNKYLKILMTFSGLGSNLYMYVYVSYMDQQFKIYEVF